MPFDLAAYLERIGADWPEPTPAGLAALQRAQLGAIAFENIDPFLGRLPDLTEAAIWRKLVVGRRGGYCLELNGLFGAALVAAGFSVRPVLGRVRMGAAEGGPRAHLAQIVETGGRRFLADAGFGGPGPDVPLDLAERAPVDTAHGRFRLRDDDATSETVLERDTPDGWFALYGFDEVAVTRSDVDAANVVCALGPASPFPQHLMIGRVLPGGRAGLMDLRLTTGGETRAIAGHGDFGGCLSCLFGLHLDEATLDALWRRMTAEGDRRLAG